MTTAPPPVLSALEHAKEQRLRVAAVGERQSALAADLNLSDVSDRLASIATQARSDAFKVLVLGEFNAGKSTLITAMLGADVLPRDAVPATAVITRVIWGERQRAELFRRPTPANPNPAPEAVDPAALHEHIVANLEEDLDLPPYELAVVQWPLPLLRSGVEIIDSPGLNATQSHQEITTNYVAQSDAVIMVMSAAQPAKRGELDVVSGDLIPRGHRSIFFVVNRINELRDPRDRERVIEYATKRLTELTDLGTGGVHFVNAIDALLGRAGAAPDVDLDATGMPAFERALEAFLTTERAKIKIVQPAEGLRTDIAHMRDEIIPDREALLATDLQELERRVVEQQAPMLRLREERDLTLRRIDAQIVTLTHGLEERARPFYERAAAELGEYLSAYEPENAIRIKFELPQNQAERLLKELVDECSDWLAKRFDAFAAAELEPFLAERLATLNELLTISSQQFGSHIDEIRDYLAAGDARPQAEQEEVTTGDRIFATFAGILAHDPAAAMMGFSYGTKEALKSIAPQLAVAAVGFFVLAMTPAGIIALLAGTGVLQLLRKGGMLGGKITKQVADGMAENLRSTGPERAATLARHMGDQVVAMRDAFKATLDEELQALEAQVEQVLSAKRSGEATVEQERRRLAKIRAELGEADVELEQVVAEFAGVN